LTGEEDMGVGHKRVYSTLQNNVYKWTNIATCRLCLTNLRPIRTVRIAYFFRRYMIFCFVLPVCGHLHFPPVI